MEFDFYYADLQVGVTFKSDKPDVFAELTDNEVLALQQIVYLSLNTFLLTRTLYLKECIESLERIEQAGKKDTNRQDGG